MTDREAFEAAMRERGWEDYELKREKDDDGYGDHDARLAWSVWKAAIKHEREACAKECEARSRWIGEKIIPSLPKQFLGADSFANGALQEAEMCAAAIRERSGLDG